MDMRLKDELIRRDREPKTCGTRKRLCVDYKLNIKWADSPDEPDEPCPSCGSANHARVDRDSDPSTWSRSCWDCQALWGVERGVGGLYTFLNTAEAVSLETIR